MDNPIFWIIIALLIFIVGREIMLWYWRINTIVKNQEEQLDLTDRLIGEISIQNRLLLKISKSLEQQDQIHEENNESTPQ